jgi:hypothetical protein
MTVCVQLVLVCAGLWVLCGKPYMACHFVINLKRCLFVLDQSCDTKIVKVRRESSNRTEHAGSCDLFFVSSRVFAVRKVFLQNKVSGAIWLCRFISSVRGKCYMYTKIPPFDSVKQYLLIPIDSFSQCQHYRDLWAYGLWKSSEILSNYAIVWTKI